MEQPKAPIGELERHRTRLTPSISGAAETATDEISCAKD
jgi:hypothetical protein